MRKRFGDFYHFTSQLRACCAFSFLSQPTLKYPRHLWSEDMKKLIILKLILKIVQTQLTSAEMHSEEGAHPGVGGKSPDLKQDWVPRPISLSPPWRRWAPHFFTELRSSQADCRWDGSCAEILPGFHGTYSLSPSLFSYMQYHTLKVWNSVITVIFSQDCFGNII